MLLSAYPSDCIVELSNTFGNGVVNSDNSLNREEMRKIAFASCKDNLSLLNSITHKHILKETLKTASVYQNAGHRIVLIDAPLLFESGFDKLCEINICVSADDETCIRRIVERDNISHGSAVLRLQNQISREEIESRSDIVIKNDFNSGSIQQLRTQVKLCVDTLEKHYREEFVGEELK